MPIFIDNITTQDDYLLVTVRIISACCRKKMVAICKKNECPVDAETFQEFNGYTRQLIEDAVNAYKTTPTT